MTESSPAEEPSKPPPLKRKPRKLHIELPHAHLYLEDVEAIAELLTELGGHLEIETEDFELTDIADLTRVDKVQQITFRVTQGDSATVTLGSRVAAISSDGRSSQTRGVLMQIVDLVRARRYWWDWLDRDVTRGIGVAVFGGAIVLALLLPGSLQSNAQSPNPTTLNVTALTGTDALLVWTAFGGILLVGISVIGEDSGGSQ
jgi:hypothetical protein